MRILLVTAEPPGPPMNGIGKFVQEFIPVLKEKAEVKVLSLQLDPYLVKKEILPEITTGVDSWADWAYRFENDWFSDSLEGRFWLSSHKAYIVVKTILEEYKPDIIYLQSPKVWLPFRDEKNVVLALHSLGKEIVGRRSPDAGWVAMWRIESEAIHRAKQVVVFSTKMKRDVLYDYEVTIEPKVVSLGIETKGYDNKKTQMGLDIAFFGRLVDSDKGCLPYLKAAKEILSATESMDIRFHVYGAGPDAKAEDYPEINFHGHTTGAELIEAFNKTHIVIMPSRQEPFGYVGLEAMAAGCLLLCTEGQGMDDYLEKDWNYVPIEPTVSSIKSNLEEIFKNPAPYFELAFQGPTTAEKWTWLRSVNQHLAAFHDVLAVENTLVEG